MKQDEPKIIHIMPSTDYEIIIFGWDEKNNSGEVWAEPALALALYGDGLVLPVQMNGESIINLSNEWGIRRKGDNRVFCYADQHENVGEFQKEKTKEAIARSKATSK